MPNKETLRFADDSNLNTQKRATCEIQKEPVVVITDEIGNIRTYCKKSISGNPENPCLGCPSRAESPDRKMLEFLENLN